MFLITNWKLHATFKARLFKNSRQHAVLFKNLITFFNIFKL